MFNFSKPEDGSEQRYDERVANNSDNRIKHHGWWVVHNCVAHPFIGLAPSKWAFDFHDWTSRQLNKGTSVEEPPEKSRDE